MGQEIPRALSGSGVEILERIHKPLLSSSRNFDRVSSYFGIGAFVKSISEIAEVWGRKGRIRLIISPADTSDIHIALQNAANDMSDSTTIIEEIIEDAVRKIHGEYPEKVESLKQMILHGLLEVVVVKPKSGDGIFHSKFSIYHIGPDSEYGSNIDEEVSKYVAVHGSFNETSPGYGNNVEDASTHRSWVPGEFDVARVFKLRFDELWNDFSIDSISIPITTSIRKGLDIASETQNDLQRTKELSVEDFLNYTEQIPHCSGYSKSVWLLPHQASVVYSASDYKPVRAMLCDEVGLGKTIQAGTIASRLYLEGSVSKIAIVAPRATLTQWASELSSKFKMPASILADGKFQRYFEGDILDEVDGRTASNSPTQIFNFTPIVILSKDWLVRKTPEFMNELSALSDLLILDEAHHARIRNWEKREGTKLWHLIKEASNTIPNVLLLTATPYQTGQQDYFGLLDIIMGLTQEDMQDLHLGKQLVSGEVAWNPNLQGQVVRSIHRRKEFLRTIIPDDLYEDLVDNKPPLSLSSVMRITQEHDITEEMLHRTLPNTRFTFRNTRKMLKQIGINFPKVSISNVPIEPGPFQNVLHQTYDFIINHLGGRDSSGIERGIYYQRAVSSLEALESTLRGRMEGIHFSEMERANFDLKWEDISPISEFEIIRIERIVNELEELRFSHEDPKITKLVELISDIRANDHIPLIFSRFTDTTEAIEMSLWDHFPELCIGRYDGQIQRIKHPSNHSAEQVTKDILVSKLQAAEIDIIVCSDAASEGLNLQTASAIINVDVPWNPARVLQRIGRADRLGQKSPEVLVYNLAYLDTIEERMYRKLDDRQTDAMQLLGDFPQLLQTEESRLMFQPFGSNVDDRLFDEAALKRDKVVLDKLLSISIHNESKIAKWINILIESNQEESLSSNPAEFDFVLRSKKVKKQGIKIFTSSESKAEIGYSESPVGKHALLLKTTEGFIPLTPSTLAEIYAGDEGTLPPPDTLDVATEIFMSEYGAIPYGKRNPGLRAIDFNNHPEKFDYEFKSLHNVSWE